MTLLTYIEATGSQYINTNISPTANTSAEIFDLTPVTASRYGTFFGEGNQSGRIWSLRYAGSNNYLQFQMGADNAAISLTTATTGGTYYIKVQQNYAIVNNTPYSGVNQSITNPVTTLKVFANGSGENGKGRIREIKIYENNVLIADLHAAKENGVAGMYDLVNDTFYTNAGSGSFGEGEEILPRYTIVFNANSGEGYMPDQLAPVDQLVTLNPCQFTKEQYMFSGWALSSSGPVVYENGAEVFNLAEEGESITLYAVWTRPTLKCTLQYNKSENNRAVKELENIREFSFKLKDPTSIIDPVIVINGNIAEMLTANYMTIPIFGRSYFINNITSVKQNLVEISAHVDVLSSYINYLKECDAIIHRQENKWNLYLDDGIFKTYQNPRIGVTKFPSGFSVQNFVLAVAGD